MVEVPRIGPLMLDCTRCAVAGLCISRVDHPPRKPCTVQGVIPERVVVTIERPLFSCGLHGIADGDNRWRLPVKTHGS
jgi:hypothetical protein